jgi:nickel/cobalt transporter (NicO) family protein
MRRRLVPLIALLFLAAMGRPAVAWAHPLGNFTINRYSRLEVQPALIRIRYVLDEAEIPTYQDMALLHPGGAPTAAEQQRFLVARVEQLRANIHLTVDGQPLGIALEPDSAALSFPPGQGGLPLLRATAWFRADLGARIATGATVVDLVDDNYDDRLGWKEIVVRGLAGVAIQQSTATAVDQSDELRSYPQDMLSSPLDVRSAHFSFMAAPGSGGGATGNLLQPRGRSTGFLAATTDAFTALISRQALSLPFILFALLAAVVLGGVHALSPGHGKTIVGAYLVGSRGTARHAGLLGLTVTITHTSGVFALGFLTLFASRYIVPERLYPWLSATSGLLVAVIGGWLLFVRLRAATRLPNAATGHRHAAHRPEPAIVSVSAPPLADARTQPHEQGQAHAHEHRHTHIYPMYGSSEHGGHAHAPDVQGVAHLHDGVSHQHHLPAGQITPRGLVALGVSGGLLPCPSALVVLLAAISLHRVAFGIVLVIAFSIGLAGVLTGIGLLLVYARGLFARFRLELGLWRLLPAASAAVVLALGLAISLQAVAQSGLFS